MIVQGVAYGEHRMTEATANGHGIAVNAAHVSVQLAPGAGGRVVLKMQRYANQPTLRMPMEM